MKHPGEATLALYAGQDLGTFARWRTRRHLEHCAGCRGEMAEFSALRQDAADLADLAGLPGVSWNRLAAEMKANIHLGLAAGECVRDSRVSVDSGLSGLRAAVACASVAVLLLAGFLLERPAPVADVERQSGISLQATGYGVEVRNGDQAFVLKNGPGAEVTYSAGAQGSIGARFVDRSTGYVTINTVYVQ